MSIILKIKKWYAMIPYNEDWKYDMLHDPSLYIALFLLFLIIFLYIGDI